MSEHRYSKGDLVRFVHEDSNTDRQTNQVTIRALPGDTGRIVDIGKTKNKGATYFKVALDAKGGETIFTWPNKVEPSGGGGGGSPSVSPGQHGTAVAPITRTHVTRIEMGEHGLLVGVRRVTETEDKEAVGFSRWEVEGNPIPNPALVAYERAMMILDGTQDQDMGDVPF